MSAETGRVLAREETAVVAALQLAARRREVMILETPYLRLESSFVRVDEDAIHANASMGCEDALYALKSSALKLRFPHAFSFVEARTQLLGFGMVAGRRTIRLRIPDSLDEDEQRRAYRVERVGSVHVTFSTRKFQLLSATLVNLSTMGARVAALRDLPLDEVRMGDRLALTIPLRDDIYINHHGSVRYVNERAIGLEFDPPFSGKMLDGLSRWVFQRREEDHERALHNSEMSPASGPGVRLVRHQGILLVSSDQSLEDSLREIFVSLPSLRRIPPTSQALKEIDLQSDTVLIFQLLGSGVEERRRAKMLTELVGGKLPFVLLAPGDADLTAVSELGMQLKAAATFRVGAKPNPLLPRMILGIFRRHFAGSPSA